MPRLWLPLLLAAVLGSPPAGADEPMPWWKGTLSLRFGIDWSTGDFDGGEDTQLGFVPVSLAYEFEGFPLTPYDWDLFELRVSAAYLRVRGPDDFFTDGAEGESPNRRSSDGFGDTWLSGTYIFLPKAHMPLPVVELTGKVKIPTASEGDDLGTGKTDGSLEMALSRRFGRVSPVLSAGWRFLKDPPQTNLRSHATAGVGASVRVSDAVTTSLLYDWRGSSAKGRADAHELVGQVSWRVRPDFAISPYAVWGVAGYVPDYAVGATFRYSIRID